jgi:hypothetical protein
MEVVSADIENVLDIVNTTPWTIMTDKQKVHDISLSFH